MPDNFSLEHADRAQIGIKVSRHVPNVPPPFYRRFRTFDRALDR